jgi:hypothetical protein
MMTSQQPKAPGLPAGQLEQVFRKANVLVAELDNAASQRSKATLLGNFLKKNLDREVPIEVRGCLGKGTLRMNAERSKQKLYYFEVRWDGPHPQKDPPQSGQLGDGLMLPMGNIAERTSPIVSEQLNLPPFDDAPHGEETNREDLSNGHNAEDW